MTERREILHRFKTDRKNVVNDNSEIFGACKCWGRFHKFTRRQNKDTTLRKRLTRKKVTSTRKSKQKRRKSSRLSCTPAPPTTPSCSCKSPNHLMRTPITPESASPQRTPVFLIDTNVPGLPYRSPSANPTNLELDQLGTYHERLANESPYEV